MARGAKVDTKEEEKERDIQIDKPTLGLIIEQVSKFDATVILSRGGETVEERLVDEYAKGTVRGYKDAVEQIVEFLKDLRS